MSEMEEVFVVTTSTAWTADESKVYFWFTPSSQ
jgi:hypothetical protein